jgi:sialate O-acetylesterase
VQCVYIAGRNGAFQAAETVLLEGDHLVASHPDIPAPTAVRYAWSNNPDTANLVNSINFPASPFATDL